MIYALLVLFLVADTIVLILLLDKVRDQKRLIRHLQESPPPSLEDYEKALEHLTLLHREIHGPESYEGWLRRSRERGEG